MSRVSIAVVRKQTLIDAFDKRGADDRWLRKRELEVREGLRMEALKHG